ncbi:MAG: hypothetical protein Tsb0027_24930 [Wenzhouxiangellaceae bacterium]
MKIYITKICNFLFKALPYALFLAIGILCWRWFEFSSQESHNLISPIINGVIGGVVTSILILLFSIIWKSNITPWVENLLYKDTKIEGVWDGLLVPYIGIDEIDKRRIKIAMGVIERRRKKRGSPNVNNENGGEGSGSTEIAARSIGNDGEEEDVEAELILKDREKMKNKDDELIDRKFFIKISSGVSPIEVRAEIKRVGHSIVAQLVEIGGASQIHTYTVKGSFKNLILTGEYENDDHSNIDRGSLSLMLRENGNVLEGFFASYADGEHQMAPFKCILKRHVKAV